MNCKTTKKRFYDVPAFRMSLLIDILSSISIIIVLASYNIKGITLIIISICLLTPLIISTFIVYFYTSSTITFTKEYIIIKDYRYDWCNIGFEYYDKIHMLGILYIKTLCISYYDNKKNCNKKTYIRCSRSYYTYLISMRN